MFTLTWEGERVRFYREGGRGFDAFVKGIGWVVNDDPSPTMVRMAEAAEPVAAILRETGIRCSGEPSVGSWRE